MTTKEKQLLLQDLCARLPYGVICRFTDTFDGCEVDNVLHPDDITDMFRHRRIDIKPYLRLMSSMTLEELHECQEILGTGVEIQDGFIRIIDSSIKRFTYLEIDAVFAFLNKKMFDIRGLIPKGLALEALEGMYNI